MDRWFRVDPFIRDGYVPWRSKIISKSKDKSQFSRSKDISKKIEEIDKNQKSLKTEIEKIISSLPNLALDEVPVGKDENSNKEIKKIGTIKKFNFTPLSHYEIGKNLNMMDFDTATGTSGSRFVFLKGKLAILRELFQTLC